MKVYKERHLIYNFTVDNSYIFKKGPERNKIYNGPIIQYRDRTFAGEIMTPKVEKLWEIIKISTDEDVLSENIIVFNDLKTKYALGFKFPRPSHFRMTDKIKEKGKYSRYFVSFNDEVYEVEKKDYKYYKKTTTPYQKATSTAEVKMELNVMSVDKNRAAIQEGARIISDISVRLTPHDFMETVEYLYTEGGQLEYENGEGYVGPYHINPTLGPMVGEYHLEKKHEYLYWSSHRTYRPEGLV